MGKELSDWRKDSPSKKILREEKLEFFRQGVKEILQHGIHAHGWEEILDEICQRAEQDVEDAKNYILETERAEMLNPNMRDKLIVLLNNCSREQY